MDFFCIFNGEEHTGLFPIYFLEDGKDLGFHLDSYSATTKKKEAEVRIQFQGLRLWIHQQLSTHQQLWIQS